MSPTGSLKKDMTCSFYTGKYPEEARAPIGLQIHPGLVMKVEFRDLRAKAL